MPMDPNQAQAQAPEAQAPEANQAAPGGNFSTLLNGVGQGLSKMMEVIGKSSAASPEDKARLGQALEAFQQFQQGLEDDGGQQEQVGGVAPMEAGNKQVIPAL